MSDVCTKGKGKWMLSCNEVTKLLSNQRDGISIGILTTAKLKLHLYMCEICKGFHSIISLPDKEDQFSRKIESMPDDMRVRIQKKIDGIVK